MREELGTILAPVVGERLDPARDAHVTLDAVGARQLGVDSVADEPVHEGVLGRPRHGRLPLTSEELLAAERAEDLANVGHAVA